MITNRQLGVASAICFALCALILLSACTTTPQGKSIDRAQYADLITTFAALEWVDGATEANLIPLPVLVPLKLSAGYLVENYVESCPARINVAGVGNAITYGAAGNNLLILLTAPSPVAILGGVVVGFMYYYDWSKLEQHVWESCEV